MSTCGDYGGLKNDGESCGRRVATANPCWSHREQGRPTKYSPTLAEEICRRLGAGESLISICRDQKLPSEATVRLWAEQNREGFSARYARSRLEQLEHWADELVAIADDGRNDTYVDEHGNLRTDHDVLGRSRLRVDVRKWLLSKLRPDTYGDRGRLELTGAGGGPVQHTIDTTKLEPKELSTLEQLLKRAAVSAN